MDLELPTLTEVILFTYSFAFGYAILVYLIFRLGLKLNISFLTYWFIAFLFSGISTWFLYYFKFLDLREISPGFKSFSLLLGNLAARVSVFSFLVLAFFTFMYRLFMNAKKNDD
jgi:hypothetical protein